MRIAFVLPGSGTSGGIRSTQRYASGLRERGHHVSVLYRRTPRHLRKILRRTYHAIRFGRMTNWLDRFDGPKREYGELTADIAGENDVIIAVGPFAARDVAALPDSCGAKVEHVRGTGQSRELVREAWARPWPKIVVANHLKRAIESDGFGPVVGVIPNGVDVTEYFPETPPAQRTGVGTVWHKSRLKGPEIVHAVYQRLNKERPDTPLHLFSNYRPPRDLPPNVNFVRYPSIFKARSIYSQCRVWFSASRSEGLPNPILEATACGCATVSADNGGASDIIEPGRNGLIVPVGDANAMYDAIVRVLDDDALHERFVAERDRTVERFTWSAAVERVEAALERIVASTQGGAQDTSTHGHALSNPDRGIRSDIVSGA